MTTTRDVDSIADQLLPLDGPYEPDAMAAVAGLLPELVRRLNHATLWQNLDQSLPYPSGIDTQVSGLASTLKCMGQLVGQLAYRLGTIANDERLQVDRQGQTMTGLEATAMASQCLSEASSGLSVAIGALDDARRFTSRLAWNDDD